MVKIEFKDNGCASLFGGKMSPAGPRPIQDNRVLGQETLYENEASAKYIGEKLRDSSLSKNVVISPEMSEMRMSWLSQTTYGRGVRGYAQDYIEVAEGIVTKGETAVAKTKLGKVLVKNKKAVNDLLLKEVADENGYITVYRGIRGKGASELQHKFKAGADIVFNTDTATSWTLNKGVAKNSFGGALDTTPGVVVRRKIHVNDVYDMPGIFEAGENLTFEAPMLEEVEVVVLNKAKSMVIKKQDVMLYKGRETVYIDKAENKVINIKSNIDAVLSYPHWLHNPSIRAFRKWYKKMEEFIGEPLY